GGGLPAVNSGCDVQTQASGTVLQGITVQFNSATSSAAEAADIGNILLVTTDDGSPTATAVTISVAVNGGTATAADYTLTGTITIPVGTASGSTVSIASGIVIVDDNHIEADETIDL